MSARCYWHAQFLLDLACQQQQAGTFLFLFLQGEQDPELYSTLVDQLSGMYLSYFHLSCSNLILNFSVFYFYFFVWACQPAAIDMLSFD